MKTPTQKNILLVEDEVILAMTEKMTLEKYGYCVQIVNSGEKAIDTIQSTPNFDLILMDIDLGKGIDGTQAAALILSKHTIPILFLSSHTESEIVEKTEKISSYGYVVKNSTITVLDASIKMAFKLFNANKKTEESEIQFRQLFQNMSSINTIYDVVFDKNGKACDYRYSEISPAFEKLVNKSTSELIGNTLLEIFPQTEHYWLDKLEEAVRTGLPIHFENYSKELNSFTEITIYSPQKTKVAMTSMDVSKRKQAEIALQHKSEEYEVINEELRTSMEELQKSEEKFRLKEEQYRLIFDYSPLGLLSFNEKGCIVACNTPFAQIIGTSCDKLINLNMLTLPDQELVANVQKALNSEIGYYEGNYQSATTNSGKVTPVRIHFTPMFNTNNQCIGGVGIIEDITEQKRAERALQTENIKYEKVNSELQKQNEELKILTNKLLEMEARQNKMLANIDDVVVIFDKEGINSYKSPNIEKLFGWNSEELIGKRSLQNIHPDDMSQLTAITESLLLNQNKTDTTECRYRCKDGSFKWIEITISNLLDDPDIQGFIGNYHDITERKIAKDKILESEEKLSFVIDGVPALLAYADKNLRYIYVNKSYADWYGLNREDIVGKRICDLMPEEAFNNAYPNYQTVLEGKLVAFENKTYDKEGQERLVSVKMVPHYSNGKVSGFFSSIIDITERKYAEDKILTLLKEKELILKEVHHRIKNNMNTIYGLLILQAGTLKEFSAISALEDAGNRVKSMQLLYDKLYRSTNFTELSVAQYIPDLIDEIIANFPNSQKITSVYHIDDFVLEAKTLQPLGIIMNELITNIMKYAFIGKNDGTIDVTAVMNNKKVSVKVADNGNGLPESVNFDNFTGFGLVLVKGLTQQLNGTIRIERSQGTQIVLEFEE